MNIKTACSKLKKAHPLLTYLLKNLFFVLALPITIPIALIGLLFIIIMHLVDDVVFAYERWKDSE